MRSWLTGFGGSWTLDDVFQRIRRLLRSDRHGGDREQRVFPLCRIRHATLHPGARLWVPGVGGGNLGAGAAAALDDVGVGGEVVVAFQVRAGEPVHPIGVLAGVVETRDVPEDWDEDAFGARKRYLLEGIERVTLAPETCTNKRVPTVMGSPAGSRPEELAPPSDALLELLEQLSRIDNHWPEHWLDAFAGLPHAALGQWAATLGWRLGGDERMALFDHPARIDDVLCSALDSLHAGLDPGRRREAVRIQAHTRRTSNMPERRVEVVPDALGWAIFHPADLTTDPTVTLEQRLAQHFSMGDLVAVRAAGDGPIRLRLTAGALNAGEASRRLGQQAFRLYVRHGRLFLGGAELALHNHFEDNLAYAEAASWFDVPHGTYQALVTELSPSTEALAATFVVQLTDTDDLEQVAAPTELPSLGGAAPSETE